MDINNLKPGMRVRFVDERLNRGCPHDVFGAPESLADHLLGKAMMVVAVRPEDQTGKRVAVVLKQAIAGGHSCDGLVPHGHGVWVLPEHLYTEEEYKIHVAAMADWAEQQNVTLSMANEFIDE